MKNLKTRFSEKNEDVKEWLKDVKEWLKDDMADITVLLLGIASTIGFYKYGYYSGTMNGLNQSIINDVTKDVTNELLDSIKNSSGGIRFSYNNEDGTKSSYIFKANKVED